MDTEKKVYILDRILDSMDAMATKLLGGRFITLLIDSIVYPGAVVICGYLAVKGKLDTATFIAVLGGYALLVKETRLSYFNRGEKMDAYKQAASNNTEVTSTTVVKEKTQ